MERIASLRRAIAEGTYRISAADIAEKIIAHMLANRPTIH
jgi:anti-sigma28 factor (negative regulator of flagellin synthesis)